MNEKFLIRIGNRGFNLNHLVTWEYIPADDKGQEDMTIVRFLGIEPAGGGELRGIQLIFMREEAVRVASSLKEYELTIYD